MVNLEELRRNQPVLPSGMDGEDGEAYERNHALDLEDIRRNQVSNAVSFSREFNRIDETVQELAQTGLYVGYKLANSDPNLRPEDNMTCLGLSERSLKAMKCEMPYFCASRGVRLREPSETGDLTVHNNAATVFPSFQRFERPYKLPGKCYINSSDSRVQLAVEKIWNGECVYHVLKPNNDLAEEGICFTLVINTTDDEQLFRCYGYSLDMLHPPSMMMAPFLQENLDFQQKMILSARALHQFLREYAHVVPRHILEMFLLESGSLELALRSSKKYKEAYLDWVILKADLVLNLPPTSKTGSNCPLSVRAICRHLHIVATAMASMSRFEDIGPLYIEMGDTFKSDKRCYFQAGISFQCAGRGFEDQSLGAFLMHFRRVAEVDKSPTENDLKVSPYVDVLSKMLMVHFAKYEVSMSRHDRANMLVPLDQDARIAIGFLALYVLNTSGTFGLASEFGEKFEELFGFASGTSKSALKQKFWRSKMATRELLFVIKSRSIREYNDNLGAVLDPGAVLPFRPRFEDTRISEDLLLFEAEGAKKYANAISKEATLEHQICANCHEHNDKTKFKTCPCGKVAYCDKTCQRADWKKHKKFCTWHKQNNKK